jgi:ribonuclease E
MSRKLLINAQRPEEVRVAIVNEGVLDQYEVSTTETGLYRGNIYRGTVANVQPSLDAAFVDFGVDKHGLLRAEDVVPAAVQRKGGGDGKRPRIDRLLEKGRPILVQVVRDGIGTKGALLTTNVSIAGRYLVLMPFEETRGISRKLEDSETRGVIRQRLEQLDLPDGFGVIARTNAGDQPKSSLNRDLNALLRLWKRVRSEAATGKGARLLYSDQDLILQVLRDSLDASIDEVLVDDDDAHDKVRAYMRTFMPRAKTRLTRYSDRMPLFSRFQLEDQIDRIYQRKVELPSGGSIVIDGTEALTAIDVNSGRSRKGGSQEDTAVNTNVEAAREVARQLRLRDIGGLMVVDFIDMRSAKNRREVERTLREAMKDDRAKFTVGRLSSNGLLEINRQRLKKELKLRTYRACPTCSGTGSIASPELVGLNLLRRIETRAVTGRLKRVRVELHPELADAIQNERRHELAGLEDEFEIRIEIIAATRLHRSEEHVEWFQRDEPRNGPEVPVAAVTVADLGGGSGGPSGKRSESQGDAAAGESEGGAEDTPKSRKRRRGGRRRKKEPKEPKAAEAAEAAKAAEAAPEPKPDSSDPAEQDGAKPAKRRPRRRRRRKPKAKTESQPES